MRWQKMMHRFNLWYRESLYVSQYLGRDTIRLSPAQLSLCIVSFTYDPSIRCVSHRIDTWQIVDRSSIKDKESCPTILIQKSEINVPWKAVELANIHRFQLPVAS